MCRRRARDEGIAFGIIHALQAINRRDQSFRHPGLIHKSQQCRRGQIVLPVNTQCAICVDVDAQYCFFSAASFP